MTDMKLRDYLQETRLITGRLVWLSTFMFLLMAVLISRLVYLQVVQSNRFSTMSQDNRISLETVTPVRGDIYDRKGYLIAMNKPVFNLEVIPNEVDDIESFLVDFTQVVELSEEQIERFERLRKRNSSFNSILLKTAMAEAEIARFAVNQHRFPGVSIKGNLSRHYYDGKATSHVIGYVGRISAKDLERIDKSQYRGISYIGKLGLEASYEAQLKGSLGYEYVETNAHGQTMRVISKAAANAGKDLHLTLDLALQKAAIAALGDNKGAVVAIEPATGDILAFASMPDYDANLFVNGIDQASYSALRDDEAKPLLNRALSGRYAPGSTIKGLVALAALDQGVSPDQKIYCPGWFSFPNSDYRYRCWKHWGHGMMNLHSAIEQSCDVYFYQISLALGIDGIHDHLTRFGLGKKTGIDFLFEPTGLIPSKAWKEKVKQETWYRGETVISAIGQGYMLTTPLQLAVATATIANRGGYITPRLVQGYGDPKNKASYQSLPPQDATQSSQSPDDFKQVIEAMRAVVESKRGTASKIGIDAKYTIAGKTGTAQVVGIAQHQRYDEDKLDKKYHDHALFVAFAPVENPQIAIAVVVENGGSGSKTAAPIARKVMDYYFETRDLVFEFDQVYVDSPVLGQVSR